MAVDRENRDKLAASIARYLEEKTTAFQFADETYSIRDASNDATVEYVVGMLWYFYDDCTDHKVVLSKPAWDYIHRLLLLLNSDSEVQTAKFRIWSWRQPVALLALMVFVWSAIELGFGEHLLIVAVPFGAVSMILSRWGGRDSRQLPAPDSALTPFTTISEIARTRRRIVDFKKRRYPSKLASRRIRRFDWHLPESVQVCVYWLFWLLFAPVVLAFQSFPRRVVTTRIVVP